MLKLIKNCDVDFSQCIKAINCIISILQNVDLARFSTIGLNFDFNSTGTLDTLVKQRTAELFDLVPNNGRDMAVSFLDKVTAVWESDPVYIEMQRRTHPTLFAR